MFVTPNWAALLPIQAFPHLYNSGMALVESLGVASTKSFTSLFTEEMAADGMQFDKRAIEVRQNSLLP